MVDCSKAGLVLEGGGFRAIFVAGVLEAFQRNKLHFPYVIGVSAGAAYGVSYVTHQEGRNLQTNKFIDHPDYCGLKHWAKNGNYFNWEYIYKTIPTNIIPLDYAELANSTTHFQVVVTNCITGKPEYFDANISDPEILRDLLTATSSLPYVAKMKAIGNLPYLDGGLSDPIPLEQAFKMGNKKVVVVLTRPFGYRKQPTQDAKLLRLIYNNYPELVKTMMARIEKYNKTMDLIEELEKTGRLYAIRPIEPIPIGRMQNDVKLLETQFKIAVDYTETLINRLNNWLNS